MKQTVCGFCHGSGRCKKPIFINKEFAGIDEDVKCPFCEGTGIESDQQCAQVVKEDAKCSQYLF